MARAFSHVGLATLDMDATRAFYENVLGFPAVRCDVIEVQEGAGGSVTTTRRCRSASG